jgi:hypothetical protein
MLCLVPLVFLLASCVKLPHFFPRPLGDPESAPIDKALEGEWICFAPKKDARTTAGLRFLRKEGNLLHLHTREKDGWRECLPVFTTIIGCDRYLNMGKPEVGYMVFKYSLSLDGILMMAAIRDEHLATAIEEKRLKGKVVRNPEGEVTSFQVTDSVENIRAFIDKEDPKKLFGAIASFRKARDEK